MSRLKIGPNYFGKRHHPAIGIRIPEIFLSGIGSALKKYHTASGLMLSYGRETSLEKVINASAGKYPISLGHTGTSIPAYIKASLAISSKFQIPIELEADHLIVIGSADLAVKRIEGVFEHKTLDQKKLRANLKYNFSAIDEALSRAKVRAFTTDTSDLIRRDLERLSPEELRKEFEKNTSPRLRKEILNRYTKQRFKIPLFKDKSLEIEFSPEEIFYLFLKYQASLRANAQIYDYLWKKAIGSRSFGFEISMDETEFLTPVKEAFFYLNEWVSSGRHFDYFAPNIGFKKRADYQGNLSELGRLVQEQAGIAGYFNNALLSFHSGSGTTPWSGKGKGVYPVLLKATGARLKYKISGVYYELLLELLHQGEAGAEGSELYNEIFDRVYEFCKEQIKHGKELASDLLRKQITQYEEDLNKGRCSARDSRADFFRFNSWLALAFRDERNQRIYRSRLVQLYQTNNEFKKKMDQEVFELTERLIKGLHFQNNY